MGGQIFAHYVPAYSIQYLLLEALKDMSLGQLLQLFSGPALEVYHIFTFAQVFTGGLFCEEMEICK